MGARVPMIADRFWPISSSEGSIADAEKQPWLITPALVGFYFSFRAAITLFAVRLLLLEPQTGAAVSLGLDFLLLLVVGFQASGATTHPLRWMWRVPGFRWVTAYLAFAGCSFAWSGAVSRSTSFAYWCGIAADVALVVLMLRVGTIEGVAHSFMKGFIYSTCVLALVAWMMPAQPDLRLGDPEFFNTNQIGNVCAFAILLAQYLMCRKDGNWSIAVAFLVVTLVRSLSKTTLVAFLLCEGFLLARDRTIPLRIKLSIAAGALAVGLCFWGLYESYYDVYTTAGNQAETLTGRTAIWAYALNAAVEKPWLGNGFDALWKVMPPFGPDQFEARHAENEVLQQFFAYGAAGVVLLVGLYGSLYRRARKIAQQPLRVMFYTILIFVIVRGLAEAEPFDLLLPLWAITLFSAIAEISLTSKSESPASGPTLRGRRPAIGGAPAGSPAV